MTPLNNSKRNNAYKKAQWLEDRLNCKTCPINCTWVRDRVYGLNARKAKAKSIKPPCHIKGAIKTETEKVLIEYTKWLSIKDAAILREGIISRIRPVFYDSLAAFLEVKKKPNRYKRNALLDQLNFSFRISTKEQDD